jgi:hypothetical protein
MCRKSEYMKRLKTLSQEEKLNQLVIALQWLAIAVTTKHEENRQTHCDDVASELLEGLEITL